MAEGDSGTAPRWAWVGKGGQAPPFDRATPAALDHAADQAILDWRRAVARIVGNGDPPSFLNTMVALEEAAIPLDRVRQLLRLYASTCATPELEKVETRRQAELGRAEDDALLDPALFARVAAIQGGSDPLDAEDRRLVELTIERLRRRGATLDTPRRDRLGEINAAIAADSALFERNVAAEEERDLPVIDAAELDGLSPDIVAAAATLAAARGRPGEWAIALRRPTVMAVLTAARDRTLRERLWRAWTMRCGEPGLHDNRPLMARILQGRADKARLLGHVDYAHHAFADRMIGRPEAAEALITAVASTVLPLTERRVADMTRLAQGDGIADPLEPWDRYHYEERLRRECFAVDGEALRQYLPVAGMIDAVLEAASRLHGIAFDRLPDDRAYHPEACVFAVRRNGRMIGVLHLDLIARAGKRNGSWTQQLQPHSTLLGGTLPIAAVVTSVPAGAGGAPELMAWQHAVVLFHEMGHALHLADLRYPGLGPMHVPWDLIELPALLNERWIEDRALLRRYLCHWQTGEPIPDPLLEGVFAAARDDRVFTLTLDYLAGALIDLRLHAGDVPPDPESVERDVLARLGVPHAIDQVMRPPHFYHLFTEAYAAGVYSYLWGDVLAADVAEAFLAAPGRFYDEATGARWREAILAAGARASAANAFHAFRGRDPSPDALFRRFGIAA